MKKPYIIENGAIFCQKCGNKSHNPNDVQNCYCGNCKTFHAETDVMYEDLFGNGFIYNTETLNEDCVTMHDNFKSGEWTLLRVTISDNEPEMTKMLAFAQVFDKSCLIHEIGGTNGLAFIKPQKMSDGDKMRFRTWFSKTLVFGKW